VHEAWAPPRYTGDAVHRADARRANYLRTPFGKDFRSDVAGLVPGQGTMLAATSWTQAARDYPMEEPHRRATAGSARRIRSGGLSARVAHAGKRRRAAEQSRVASAPNCRGERAGRSDTRRIPAARMVAPSLSRILTVMAACGVSRDGFSRWGHHRSSLELVAECGPRETERSNWNRSCTERAPAVRVQR
jgi:hypothetical protein